MIFPFPDSAPKLALVDPAALIVAHCDVKRDLCFCGFLPILVHPSIPTGFGHSCHLVGVPCYSRWPLRALSHCRVFWVTRLGSKLPSCPPPPAAACQLWCQEPPRTVIGPPRSRHHNGDAGGLTASLPRSHPPPPWQPAETTSSFLGRQENQVNSPAERLPGVLPTASSETAQLPSPEGGPGLRLRGVRSCSTRGRDLERKTVDVGERG